MYVYKHIRARTYIKGIFHCKSYACSYTHAYSLSRVRKTIRLAYMYMFIYAYNHKYRCMYVCDVY